jgi:two-component system sensor histidine kinase HydH
MGVDWKIAGRDATLLVGGWFSVSFTALGWLAGRLALARSRARADAETILEQKLALERTRRVAIQNEKLAAIGRLAAGVAHEVRNPLGVIRSSAAMVQEGFAADDDSHRACQFICEEIDRLDGLITSLLTFARPVDLHTKEVPIDSVVERALVLAGPELDRRGLSLSRQPAQPVPCLRVDPDLVAQVVLGLVTNAAEATPQPGCISVRTGEVDGHVHVDVADSGPGVPEDLADQVFEPFFTTKPTGTGLGLAMAARIVQAHGGHIQVLSGHGAGLGGAGACFRVALPVSGEAAS